MTHREKLEEQIKANENVIKIRSKDNEDLRKLIKLNTSRINISNQTILDLTKKLEEEY